MRFRLRYLILVTMLFAIVGGAATASSGAPGSASASCNLKPFYGEYLCAYYGFVSGTHSERWTINFDHAKIHPGERCPYATGHSSGGVDVKYASARSGRKRAKFVTRWKGGAPYDLMGATPYVFFNVSLKRFAQGSAQDPVGPPDACVGAVTTIDSSKCGSRAFNKPDGSFENDEGATATHRYVMILYVENKDFQDCADAAGWSLAAGAPTKYFHPGPMLKKPKFTLQVQHTEVVPLKAAGLPVGRVVVRDQWTATFCQTGKIKPARCRP
jgi:hypothetical protein